MTEFIDRAGLPEATEFIRRKLTAFNLSKLDKLTLKASLRTNPLSWRVKKPVRLAKGSRQFKSQFEVTGSVIGEKCYNDESAEAPVIASKEFGEPPELTITLSTREQMLVYAAAAGLYHFLRRTKQVPGVAANWMARRYACGWAAEFSAFRKLSTPIWSIDVWIFHLHFNCFGVAIPTSLVEETKDGPIFFEYRLAANRNNAELQSAIGEAIDRTFCDCDQSLVSELKAANRATDSWLILADWLEERGDPRAAWIRSHRLEIPKQWAEESYEFETLIRKYAGIPDSPSK